MVAKVMLCAAQNAVVHDQSKSWFVSCLGPSRTGRFLFGPATLFTCARLTSRHLRSSPHAEPYPWVDHPRCVSCLGPWNVGTSHA